MFWRVLLFLGSLTFLGTACGVLADDTCKSVDFGGNRRSLMVTCYTGTQGETAAGTAGALLLLAGFGMLLLALWPLIRPYFDRPAAQGSFPSRGPIGANSSSSSPPPPPPLMATRQQKIERSKSLIAQQPPGRRPLTSQSLFGDAEEYARENAEALIDGAERSVFKAKREIPHIARRQDAVWVFADSSKPFVVALPGGTIYEFGESSMRKHSDRLRNIRVRGIRRTDGRLQLVIGDRLVENLQPPSNAERLVKSLGLEVADDNNESEKSEAILLEEISTVSSAVSSGEEEQLIRRNEPLTKADESLSRASAEALVSDFEGRLRTLKELFDQDLISGQEYSEKRRAILDEL